jgi:hypothetical protein
MQTAVFAEKSSKRNNRQQTGHMKKEEQQRRGGGPKTPEGKQRSSQNSTRHGMRAKTIRLLPDEDPDEYESMVAGWQAQWQPDDYQEHKLVKTLIHNDWMHRRAEHWLMETEASIVEQSGLDPMGWTDEQERKLQLVQRYKTSAERAFYRAWSALQGLRKDVLRTEEKLNKLSTELAVYKAREEAQKQNSEPKAQAAFGGQKSKTKQKKIATLEQVVEIEVAPWGETITTRYPSDKALLDRGQKMSLPPDLVLEVGETADDRNASCQLLAQAYGAVVPINAHKERRISYTSFDDNRNARRQTQAFYFPEIGRMAVGNAADDGRNPASPI